MPRHSSSLDIFDDSKSWLPNLDSKNLKFRAVNSRISGIRAWMRIFDRLDLAALRPFVSSLKVTRQNPFDFPLDALV